MTYLLGLSWLRQRAVLPTRRLWFNLLFRKDVGISAVSDGSKGTWEPRSLELTSMLSKAGCNPHILHLRGETPVTVVVKRGYLSVVEHPLSCVQRC